ncbi:MAG: methyltransferase domain-containing protein [Caulobacteraceae bacterium]|nr:methyltransferase domain-containing protein [Caulobacteraceae bacterium]
MINAYDEIAYATGAFPQTHPDSLAAQALLFGLQPAPIGSCRVLEVGAGDGSNLIPMALGLPDAEFVGFDLAGDPVRRGIEVIEKLGLRNVRLFQADILDVDLGPRPFDYIIAQGVYSWTPDHVRAELMRLVGRLLAPDGVAYVSYNALPGGYVRLAVRHQLLFETRDVVGRTARVEAAAGALRGWPAPAVATGTLQRAIAEEAAAMRGRSFSALAHDELSDAFHPVYLTDFAAQCAESSLRILTEAEPGEVGQWFAPPEISDHEPFDALARAQAADFAEARLFHQSLVVRAEAPAARRPKVEAFASMHASSNARRIGATRFEVAAVASFDLADPVLAAVLERLASIWPATAPVPTLIQDGPRLLGLLELYGLRALELHAAPMTIALGERPRASPLARLQAEAGANKLTTLRHTMVEVDDAFSRGFIASLDGSQTRAELARKVAPHFNLTPEAALAPVGVLLEVLARAPLLIG